MQSNTKNRIDLKSYFLANALPTESNFGDLIDAGLNQAEDGIAKIAGHPIALEAAGDTNGPLNVLELYENFTDNEPRWILNLNPVTDSGELPGNRPGFNISDANGASRLYIKASDGAIGLGTIEPGARLHIEAPGDGAMLKVTDSGATSFEVSRQAQAGMLYLGDSSNPRITQLSGNPNIPGYFLNNIGIGTDSPTEKLHVEGAISAQTIKLSGPKSYTGWENDNDNDGETTVEVPDGKVVTGIKFRKIENATSGAFDGYEIQLIYR